MGKHLIKVSFQKWDYRGYVIVETGGNTKGVDVLSVDADRLFEEALDSTFRENDINLKGFGQDWFRMELKNNKGKILTVEDEWDAIESMIVGLEIVEFEAE